MDPRSPACETPPRIGIMANPQWANGRNILRGVIRFLRETREAIQTDLLLDEQDLSTNLLQEYDGFLCMPESQFPDHLLSQTSLVLIDPLDPTILPHLAHSLPIDHHGIGVLAAETLYACGVASYGFVDISRERSARERANSKAHLEGFRIGLRALGVTDLDSRLQVHRGSFSNLRKWLRKMPSAAGIFATDDQSAIQASEACRMLNLQIPGDVAIIGVGNDRLLCGLASPPLSSIDPGVGTLAYRAMQTLRGLITDSSSSPNAIESPAPRAVLRESTGHTSATQTTVQAALSLIRSQSPEERISPGKIATRVGVSLRTLQSLFEKHVGHSVQKQIIKTRLENFKHLLRTTDDTIDEISEKLQQDTSTLRANFIRAEGKTPSAFRSQFRGTTSRSFPTAVPQPSSRKRICFLTNLQGQSSRDFLRGVEAAARRLPDVRLHLRVEASPSAGAPSSLKPPGQDSYRHYDGFIATPGVEVPSGICGKKPVICFEHVRNHPLSYFVHVENHELGNLAALHFLSKGYTQFSYFDWGGFATPIGRSSIDHRHSERFEGFQRTLMENGIPEGAIRHKEFTAPEEIASWLQALPKPVAVFAFNDTLALHLMNIARETGLRVPGDIAILGIDNDEIVCQLPRPDLSSIEIGFHRLGSATLEALYSILKSKELPEAPLPKMMPSRVVERGSTRGVASEDPLVVSADRLMSKRYAGALSVLEIVDASGVSRRTLETRFQSLLGHSIAEHLQGIRLQAAVALLTNSQEPVAQIAEATGFTHSRHFCRVFKQWAGQTPLAFRRARGCYISDPVPGQ